MDPTKVDRVGQAAVNAAIAELGDDARRALVVVIVRPINDGQKMNVTSNLSGEGNHNAVAAVIKDGLRAVERGGAQLVLPIPRIIVPS